MAYSTWAHSRWMSVRDRAGGLWCRRRRACRDRQLRFGARRALYERIGRGGLANSRGPRPAAPSPGVRAVALPRRRRDPPAAHGLASPARGSRRGARRRRDRAGAPDRPPPGPTPGLRDEVRQLVLARNHRLVARGRARSPWTSRPRSSASCASSEPDSRLAGGFRIESAAMADHKRLRARRTAHPTTGDLLQPADRGPPHRRRLSRDGRRRSSTWRTSRAPTGSSSPTSLRSTRTAATSCSRPSRPVSPRRRARAITARTGRGRPRGRARRGRDRRARGGGARGASKSSK